MKEDFYKPLIEQLPVSYAYQRIICDAEGRPCDFVYLEVNPAFEAMTGAKAADIIGRRATEVMPDLGRDPFDWIGYYGHIALSGGSREFIRHAEPEDVWYSIKVYSPQKYYFITFITDITASMRPLTELDLFFNISPDLLCIVDLKGKFLKLNDAWRTVMGYSREELKDKGFWSFVHPEDRDLTREATTRLVREYRLTDFVNRYQCKDDTYKYIEWSCQRNGDRVYCVARDVTERRRVEQALRAERSLTDAIFDSVPGILYLYDEKRRLLRWNRRHEVLTGYTAEEMAGRHLLDWFKDDRESLAAISEAQRNTIGSGHGETEAFMQRKDGTRLDMYFTATMLDVDGKHYFTGMGMDISGLRKAEASLIESRERLKAILLSVGDAVITADNAGKVELMNFAAEELTGWRQDEAIGRRLEDVFCVYGHQLEKKCCEILRQIIEAPKPAPFGSDMLLRPRSGAERSIENTAAPILDRNGNVHGVVFVFRDTTEKREKLNRIEYLSYHDVLTGLFNRRFYEEETRRLNTERNLPISIIMGDINRLKLVNDAFGHAKGDEFLQKAAVAIQRGCRSDDLVARWGGDEFIVFLPRTSQAEAEEVAARITELCRAEEVNSIPVSISFGIATKLDGGTDIGETMRRAEDDLYRSKARDSEEARSDIIRVIMKTLFKRSPNEERHANRVGALCARAGKALGLPGVMVSKLQMAGQLHDIGKISVSARILEKQDELTAKEIDEIRRHSAAGYRIVSSAQDMIEIGEAILAHHERWDGSGYPKGRKGADIPLAARIIAIADCYDSMTNESPFREPATREEAIAEIEKNAGTQFDPEIAALFIKDVLGGA